MTSIPETAEAAVAALLRETEAAHGAYETTVLGGERDEDWAGWYAAYLLDHGLAALLPDVSDIEIGDLATLLGRYDEDYRRERPAWPWPDTYAQKLVAAFG